MTFLYSFISPIFCVVLSSLTCLVSTFFFVRFGHRFFTDLTRQTRSWWNCVRRILDFSSVFSVAFVIQQVAPPSNIRFSLHWLRNPLWPWSLSWDHVKRDGIPVSPFDWHLNRVLRTTSWKLCNFFFRWCVLFLQLGFPSSVLLLCVHFFIKNVAVMKHHEACIHHIVVFGPPVLSATKRSCFQQMRHEWILSVKERSHHCIALSYNWIHQQIRWCLIYSEGSDIRYIDLHISLSCVLRDDSIKNKFSRSHCRI